MVTPDQRRTRYLSDAEGAPPLPPPGGYRGARRIPEVPRLQPMGAPAPGPVPPAAPPSPAAATPRRGPNAVGIVALVAGIVFALVLLIIALAGGTDALYSPTALAFQLLVVGLVVAALATTRGRAIGTAALVVALLLNVGTVGALSALGAAMTNDYEGTKTDEQRHWEAFPGVRGLYSDEVLEQPSVEQVRSSADAMLAEIRDEITARFGYTWVRTTDEALRPERNGYGGESMLIEFQSTGWATAEPIRDESRKREVLAVIDDVVARYDFRGLIGFNEPSSGLDPSMLEKLYGSADPSLQPRWQWYSRQYYPGVMRVYAEITDLSLDSTGQFTAARQGQTADTGAPLEGLEIAVLAEDLLRESDRAEFEERMRDYPGY